MVFYEVLKFDHAREGGVQCITFDARTDAVAHARALKRRLRKRTISITVTRVCIVRTEVALSEEAASR
jgi:hypothetical protein